MFGTLLTLFFIVWLKKWLCIFQLFFISRSKKNILNITFQLLFMFWEVSFLGNMCQSITLPYQKTVFIWNNNRWQCRGYRNILDPNQEWNDFEARDVYVIPQNYLWIWSTISGVDIDKGLQDWNAFGISMLEVSMWLPRSWVMMSIFYSVFASCIQEFPLPFPSAKTGNSWQPGVQYLKNRTVLTDVVSSKIQNKLKYKCKDSANWHSMIDNWQYIRTFFVTKKTQKTLTF